MVTLQGRVQSTLTLAIFGIIPFNLIKCGINSVGAMVLYKRLSPILHGNSSAAAAASKAKNA